MKIFIEMTQGNYVTAVRKSLKPKCQVTVGNVADSLDFVNVIGSVMSFLLTMTYHVCLPEKARTMMMVILYNNFTNF